jgi:hypothetical protein
MFRNQHLRTAAWDVNAVDTGQSIEGRSSVVNCTRSSPVPTFSLEKSSGLC